MAISSTYRFLDGFIDNDEHKQKEGYKDYKVYFFMDTCHGLTCKVGVLPY